MAPVDAAGAVAARRGKRPPQGDPVIDRALGLLAAVLILPIRNAR